jgi:hypothetical protein
MRTRPIETEKPVIHQSVQDRITANPAYQVPIDLDRATWDDRNWTTPHPRMQGTTDIGLDLDDLPVEEVAP